MLMWLREGEVVEVGCRSGLRWDVAAEQRGREKESWSKSPREAKGLWIVGQLTGKWRESDMSMELI